MNVHIFTKDIMAARQIDAVFRVSSKKIYDISVFAEGKSIEEWDKRSVSHSPWPLQNNEHPDVIVVGCSTGTNTIEHRALAHAEYFNIPTIIVSDTYGSLTRHMQNGIPRPKSILVLAIDTVDYYANQNTLPCAEHVVVGDSTYPYMLSLVNERLEYPTDDSSLNNHVLFVGQGLEYTPEMLALTIKCLEKSPGWKIIPRAVHPKYKGKPEARAIEALLESIPPEKITNIPDSFSTDKIAVDAEIVISAFSTALRLSALSGTIPVSIATPQTCKGMEKSTGLTDYPLTNTNVCVRLTERMSFNHILLLGLSRDFADARRSFRRSYLSEVISTRSLHESILTFLNSVSLL